MKKYFVTAGFVVLYVAILVAVLLPVQRLMYDFLPSKSRAYTSFISKYPLMMIFTVFVVAIALYYIVFLLRKTNLFRVCSFSPIGLKKVWLLIALGLSMLAATLGLSSFRFVLKVFPSLGAYIGETMKTSGSLAALVILSCALIFCEEIIFRGVIFGELKATFHAVPAAIIHAAIYAFIIGDLVMGIISFISCLVYAFVYAVTGSLWSSVTVQLSTSLGLMLFVNLGLNGYIDGANGAVKCALLLAGLAGMAATCRFIRYDGKKRAVPAAAQPYL